MKGVSVMDSLRINLAREVTDNVPGRLPLSAPSKDSIARHRMHPGIPGRIATGHQG